MLHRNGTTNGIWTQEPVYRDSSAGKSEEFLVEGVSSLQQGFDSYSQATLSIGIDDLTTFFTSTKLLFVKKYLNIYCGIEV
jgi:hypothetical protein